MCKALLRTHPGVNTNTFTSIMQGKHMRPSPVSKLFKTSLYFQIIIRTIGLNSIFYLQVRFQRLMTLSLVHLSTVRTGMFELIQCILFKIKCQFNQILTLLEMIVIDRMRLGQSKDRSSNYSHDIVN